MLGKIMGNIGKNNSLRFLLTVGLFCILIPNSISFAAGEFSGGSIYKLFESMTADEAFDSNKFRKRVWNRHMPGTSTWYKPSNSLCVDGDKIATVQPRLHCQEWAVELDNNKYGRDYEFFTNLSQAKRKAEGSNGRGQPICIYGQYKHASTPLNSSNSIYTTEFYQKVSGGDRYDNDHFLGEHDYPVLDCVFFDRRDEGVFIETSGEFSGGSLNKL